MEITDGHYGDVSLAGVTWAGSVRWPGPLHEGRGTLQAFIDENTSQEQRDALLTFMSGMAGGTLFQILAAIIENMLEPQFVPIEFELDMDKRTARVKAGEEIETEGAPIENPVTGEEHRALVQLPGGFEMS